MHLSPSAQPAVRGGGRRACQAEGGAQRLPLRLAGPQSCLTARRPWNGPRCPIRALRRSSKQRRQWSEAAAGGSVTRCAHLPPRPQRQTRARPCPRMPLTARQPYHRRHCWQHPPLQSPEAAAAGGPRGGGSLQPPPRLRCSRGAPQRTQMGMGTQTREALRPETPRLAQPLQVHSGGVRLHGKAGRLARVGCFEGAARAAARQPTRGHL